MAHRQRHDISIFVGASRCRPHTLNSLTYARSSRIAHSAVASNQSSSSTPLSPFSHDFAVLSRTLKARNSKTLIRELLCRASTDVLNGFFRDVRPFHSGMLLPCPIPRVLRESCVRRGTQETGGNCLGLDPLNLPWEVVLPSTAIGRAESSVRTRPANGNQDAMALYAGRDAGRSKIPRAPRCILPL